MDMDVYMCERCDIHIHYNVNMDISRCIRFKYPRFLRLFSIPFRYSTFVFNKNIKISDICTSAKYKLL